MVILGKVTIKATKPSPSSFKSVGYIDNLYLFNLRPISSKFQNWCNRWLPNLLFLLFVATAAVITALAVKASALFSHLRKELAVCVGQENKMRKLVEQLVIKYRAK